MATALCAPGRRDGCSALWSTVAERRAKCKRARWWFGQEHEGAVTAGSDEVRGRQRGRDRLHARIRGAQPISDPDDDVSLRLPTGVNIQTDPRCGWTSSHSSSCSPDGRDAACDRIEQDGRVGREVGDCCSPGRPGGAASSDAAPRSGLVVDRDHPGGVLGALDGRAFRMGTDDPDGSSRTEGPVREVRLEPSAHTARWGRPLPYVHSQKTFRAPAGAPRAGIRLVLQPDFVILSVGCSERGAATA